MPESLASEIKFVTSGAGCQGVLSMERVTINLGEIWTIISQR